MNTAPAIRSFLKTPRGLAAVAAAVLALVVAVYWTRTGVDAALVATVERGEMVATLTTAGTLRPIQSITYRSPVPGRDIEIRELAPEGSHVKAGDLIARLGTTELEIDLDRVKQELRQA